jgi:hypothetical protein
MMNEKIRELAEKSELQFVVKTNDNNEDTECVEGGNGFPTAEQFKKFAELIVRECAAIDFRASIGLSNNDDLNVTIVIRKHFGVKND